MPFCKILRVRNLAWDLFGVNFWSRAQLLKRWIILSIGYISIQWIAQLVFLILIVWRVIYPVDSAIQCLNNWSQGFFGILLETQWIFLGFDCCPHLIIAVMWNPEYPLAVKPKLCICRQHLPIKCFVSNAKHRAQKYLNSRIPFGKVLSDVVCPGHFNTPCSGFQRQKEIIHGCFFM